MEITEEQRRRAEANRLVALEKRKHATEMPDVGAWKLFKCRKIQRLSPEPEKKPELPPPPPPPPSLSRFCVVLEICSPDEFSVTPEPLQGSPFPGELQCLQIIEASLSSVVPFCPMVSQGGRRTSVFKLEDYGMVLRCLKKLQGVDLQDIPYTTRIVVQKFSQCVGNHWVPSVEGHYSDEQVDELLGRLPKKLLDALHPFQLDGVKFGLRRGGRCLIADEMGLGKTIQAITIACCFKDEGPILVVCPAVLRYSWAEELEHWLPLLPKDIHLVFGHQNNLEYLERFPKVVVISYTMLNRLRKSMLEQEWALMIIDESHNLRCTKQKSESEETKALLEVAAKVKRIILLSGTPSLSRPYDIYHQINMLWPRLLGKDKYEFAKNYCLMTLAKGQQGKVYKDFSKGVRLGELNVLLRQTLMIRRLKEHVLAQLPPKRRQIIRLKLKAADILLATTTCRVSKRISLNEEHQEVCLMDCGCHQSNADGDEKLMNFNVSHDNDYKRTPKLLSDQEIGIAKLSGFREWFSNHLIIRESEDATSLDMGFGSQKTIIFAHHLKVLDGIQEFIVEKGIKLVRIDGRTLARDRQQAVEAFRLSTEVKIAIIGITAGGVGIDFSSAQNVIFLELPKSASEMVQAEDRAHRRGQINAVNIYIFCAKDTSDESHWLHLNKSLFRVSSMMNGKKDAIEEIEVDRVFHLEYSGNDSNVVNPESIPADDLKKINSVDQAILAISTYNCGYEECDSTVEHIKADNKSCIQLFPLQFEAENSQESDVEMHPGIFENLVGNNSEITQSGQYGTVSCKLDKGILELSSSDNRTLKADKMLAGTANDVDGDSNVSIEAVANSHIQTESLRFEVSQYTGRVHLYICIQGKDSRPRPLFENFRAEELELFSTGDIDKATTPQFLKENPAYYNVFKTFIGEWNDLRPIERKKLLGRPLQLPLSLELCYLKESISHGCSGLLKGGSKRRVTPLSDISRPLPENAVWKKVALHGGTAKEREYTQAWMVGDVPLCKLCQEPCNGKLAKFPEYFEDLFCNLNCFQEYRIRTSQRALREALFQIEHGVCVQCKLDCHKLVECIKHLSIKNRHKYIEKVAPMLASKKKLLDKLIHEPIEGNAWHADHMVPVYKGGGECTLENMRTLCVACHFDVTKAQRAERCLMRMRAKNKLKITMKELENGSSIKSANSSDGTGKEEVGVEPVEESPLFIKVPGSAYSRKESNISDSQENECSPSR
uniref:DNA annealing helicase and endonuclease ZRANB3 isoform X1 n=2 Tax=Elaeis guineensis var. tenera TaxID=51953 RepID=A0A6I9S1T7_ELAGV|nr:DNA annealing helicase and endonuclease ZRANB3 isoform X1 [Elaeis guineensis]